MIWASGLIEGEGCITRQVTTKRSKEYLYWQLKVTSTDYDVLERLRSSFGFGRIYSQKGNPRHKEAWQWHIYRQPELYAALVAIWPFLCSRRQARATEAIIEMGARTGWRANRRVVPDQIMIPPAACFRSTPAKVSV